MRRSGPILYRNKHHGHSDEIEAALWARDGGCVARFDSEADPCDGWIERNHVTPGYGRTSKRADSVLNQMVLVCRHHHHDGWATSKHGKQFCRVRLGIDGPV